MAGRDPLRILQEIEDSYTNPESPLRIYQTLPRKLPQSLFTALNLIDLQFRDSVLDDHPLFSFSSTSRFIFEMAG